MTNINLQQKIKKRIKEEKEGKQKRLSLFWLPQVSSFFFFISRALYFRFSSSDFRPLHSLHTASI